MSTILKEISGWFHENVLLKLHIHRIDRLIIVSKQVSLTKPTSSALISPWIIESSEIYNLERKFSAHFLPRVLPRYNLLSVYNHVTLACPCACLYRNEVILGKKYYKSQKPFMLLHLSSLGWISTLVSFFFCVCRHLAVDKEANCSCLKVRIEC